VPPLQKDGVGGIEEGDNVSYELVLHGERRLRHNLPHVPGQVGWVQGEELVLACLRDRVPDGVEVVLVSEAGMERRSDGLQLLPDACIAAGYLLWRYEAMADPRARACPGGWRW
jgi:hypothetical protein